MRLAKFGCGSNEILRNDPKKAHQNEECGVSKLAIVTLGGYTPHLDKPGVCTWNTASRFVGILCALVITWNLKAT